jgi:hypothetical protein
MPPARRSTTEEVANGSGRSREAQVEARSRFGACTRICILRPDRGRVGAFVALLAFSPATLDDAYRWLGGLPLVWEIVMWVMTLPWTVAYLVVDGSWAHWVCIAVVAAIVIMHLGACAPRAPRP